MPTDRGRSGLRLGAALIVAALLAGCIGGDDDAEEPLPPGQPIAGGELRLGIGGPLVVDPVEASLASPSDLMVLDLLHDGLTRLDADGVPRAALAESWEANPRATAFRFVLRADATFASGRRITPQDVIASLERVMQPGDASLAALSLEAVKGFQAFADGEADHVSGLSAPGPRTVRIELATPLSVLPSVLSNPVLSVVDPSTIEGELGALDLSGEWSVASSDDGDLALDRRAGSDAGLGGLELRSHDDAEEAFEAFEDGDVDWAPVPSGRYGDAVEEHGTDAFAPFHAELFFGMNVRSPALRTPAIRQAIRLAIDRDAIVSAVYSELADPLPTVVPQGVAGHDPERCDECVHDPDRAKEIVTFAYTDGDVPTVHIDFDESPTQEQMAGIVADSLESVGIPTELRSRPLDEYKAFVVSGDQELFSFGWIGAYSSPDAYLAPLFGASANDNLTRFRSSAVDGFLEGARASRNPDKNAERWQVAEKAVLEAAVVVPIAQFRTQVVIADRVQGLTHAVDGTVDWDQVSVTA
jgi:ABC-type transport system substrate-binding protein